MARCLIIGCGCRGQMLSRALAERGHAVRGTTRELGRRAEIEAAGAQCVVADPDRVAGLLGALEHVTVVLILLGSARGEAQALANLHGTRLQMLLSRMVDTTIHGVIYETRGSVDQGVLSAGAALIAHFGARSRARVALLEADPADPEVWLRDALSAVDAVLSAR